MYCTKCGKEIKDGEMYCAVCGAKGGETRSTNTAGDSTSVDLSGIKSRLENVEGDKAIMITAFIMPLVSMMFLGNEMFDVSYNVFGYENTLRYTMFEGSDFLKTLFYIGYITASVMVMLPVLTDGKWSKINFAPAMIMPVASAIMLFVAMTKAKSEAASGQYASLMSAIDMKLSISGSAWLFLLISIVTLAVAYKAYCDINLSQTRRNQRESKAEARRRDAELLACLEEMARDKIFK